MNEWIACQLGEVLTLQRGFDITKATQRDGSVPVVSSSGINSHHDEAKVQGPGVVIGRKGTLGTYFYLDEPYWPHDTTLWVKDFKGNDPKFCFYLLGSMELAKHDVGAANPTLNRNQLHLLPVAHPRLDTQRRIASILGAYDDLIEVNRRRVAVLEEMARGLFEEWFVRFRFPGHESVPLVDTPSGPLPQGWTWGELGDLIEKRNDRAKAGPHLAERVYVPIECIGRRTLSLYDHQPWENAQSSLQLFEPGDILFGAMRAYFHKVAPTAYAGVTRSTCFVLRPRQSSLASFALMALFQDATVAFAALNSSGSTIPYAKWEGVLEKMTIQLPNEETLSAFNDIVWPMVGLIMSMTDANKRLAASRDLLLPRLISGQLSVEAAVRELELAA